MMDKKSSKWLAGICVLALAACSTDSNRYGSTSGSSSTSGSGSSMPSDGAMSNSTGSSSSTSNANTATGTASSNSTTSDPGSTANNMGGTSGTMGSSSGSMGSSSGTTGGSSGSMSAGASGGASQTAQTTYGVVTAIDTMQRQDVGVGVAGAAAAGGVGAPTDKVYRVTVRMEDGSSQMVAVESMPSYKVGDKVRYSNGSLQSY